MLLQPYYAYTCFANEADSDSLPTVISLILINTCVVSIILPKLAIFTNGVSTS